MTRKPLVLAGLCVALLAAPAFAQQGYPGGTMPPPTMTAPSSPQGGMTQPNSGAPNAATPAPRARHVARATGIRSCWDLAWQSQAMKSCFAQHPEQAQRHPQAAQMLDQSSGAPSNRY